MRCEDGGEQRPPEAGQVAIGQGQVEPHGAADQEHPAEENCDRDAGQQRNRDGRHAEDHQHDAFDQKGFPVCFDGFLHLGLKPGDILRHRHRALLFLSGAAGTTSLVTRRRFC